MYCTGYLYKFPFLDSIVSTADNRCGLSHTCAGPALPASLINFHFFSHEPALKKTLCMPSFCAYVPVHCMVFLIGGVMCNETLDCIRMCLALKGLL